MKIIDGTNEQIKSPNTISVDIHIEPGEYVNIVLPSGRILTVDYMDATLWDVDESLINSLEV